MTRQRRRIRKNLRKLDRELLVDLAPIQIYPPDYTRAVMILKGFARERFSSTSEVEDLINDIEVLTEFAAPEVHAAGRETIAILMAAHGIQPRPRLDNDMAA